MSDVLRNDAVFIAELIDSHIRPEDLTPDDVPSEIGPYEVIEPIGRGRESQVYLARGPESERAVVLKHFERGTPWSPRELKARTRRLAALEERAIVPIREILEVEGRVAVCMDYVGEASLAERDLPRDKGLRYLERVARACNVVHQAGLVHGDLRPGNLLLGAQPRILDFGIAGVFDGGEEPFGDPAYMAPEVARGQEPTPASDIYSLGAVLYELLCGVPPYGLEDEEEILARLRGSEAPRSPRSRDPEVPRALERIALQALARDPRGRQESAGALAEDLATWNQEVSAPVEVSGLWAWVALGVGIPLAAILATALVGAGRTPPPPSPPGEERRPQGTEPAPRRPAAGPGGQDQGPRPGGQRRAPPGARDGHYGQEGMDPGGQGQGPPPRGGHGMGPGGQGQVPPPRGGHGMGPGGQGHPPPRDMRGTGPGGQEQPPPGGRRWGGPYGGPGGSQHGGPPPGGQGSRGDRRAPPPGGGGQEGPPR